MTMGPYSRLDRRMAYNDKDPRQARIPTYEARNAPGSPKAKRASEKAAITRRTRAQPISLAGPSGTPSSAPERDDRPQTQDRP